MKKNNQRILLIFPPERTDLYSYLSKDTDSQYFILFNELSLSNKHSLPEFIKKEYYWSEYKTPQHLISELKPDTIVFFEIFDFRQIALAICANNFNVNTVLLDHGLFNLKNYKKNQINPKNKKIICNIYKILKVRLFYYATFFYVSNKNKCKFLKLSVLLSLKSNSEAINKITFKEKNMKNYILFNKNNFSLYNYLYHLKNKKIIYSGIPYFDYFKIDSEEKNIIYIDHPYLEQNLYGWTNQHHKNIAEKLNTFSNKNKEHVYVKLHPRSNISIWKSYKLDSPYLHIMQQGNFKKLYNEAKLILSFSSTMVVGFLSALKNVVLLGWHPTPQILGVDFSLKNICHKSLYYKDLDNQYVNWLKINKSKQQKKYYDIFIKEFNYPFDGKATKRVIENIHLNKSI